jgi:hypothetical protein
LILFQIVVAIRFFLADGYILEMHRIPFSRRVPTRFQRSKQFGSKYAKRVTTRPVVFLQHGLLCSSSDWVLNPTDRGLGKNQF